MGNKTIFSVSFLLILFSIPNSLAISQNSTLDSQGNYANPTLGISFQAPPGWTVEEPKKSDSSAPDVAVIAPYSNGFTASISFVVEKSNGISLDDYIKNKESQLTGNQSNDITFISEQDKIISGFPAKVILLQENFSSPGTGDAVEFKQTVLQANDKFYTVTYANEKKNFDSDLPSYEQLLATIKIGNNDSSSTLDYLSIGIVGIAVAAGVVIKRKNTRLKKAQSG